MQRYVRFPTLAILCAIAALSVAGWSQTPAAPGAKAPVMKKSPLVPYAGTWTATSRDKTFATLHLTLNGEQLTGSIQHPKRIDTDDNGEVKNFSDDFSTAVVQEAELTGDGVLLTAKDDSSNEVDRFSMRLTGDSTASLKMLAMAMPPGMAKPKPWKLTKAGAAPPVPPSR